MNAPPGPDHYLAAAEFVLMLRSAGLRDTRVLRAMEQVPRAPFLDPRWFPLADLDIALPIGCGESLLAPSLTGAMLEALGAAPDHRVLQVGVGSGYAAAILGRLAREVVAVDRWRRLADEAHARLRGLGYYMVDVVVGDGREGHAPRAPYDRILATCAFPEPPSALLAQLKPDGVLVCGLRDENGATILARFRATAPGEPEPLGLARLPPARMGVSLRL